MSNPLTVQQVIEQCRVRADDYERVSAHAYAAVVRELRKAADDLEAALSAGERSSAPTVTPSAAIEQPYKGAHGLVRNFLSRLPFPDRLPAPTVQVEDDGDLGIDWDESRDATVSVSLRESGVVCWAALINGRSEHGVFGLPSWSPAFNDAMTRLGEALGERSSAPIYLSDTQERAIKEWTADDRLWNTQDTVEINLRTFARVCLRGAKPQSSDEGREALPENKAERETLRRR